MGLRSWLQMLARWAGGAPPQAQAGGGNQAAGAGGKQQEQPAIASPVLREAMAHTDLADAAEPALTGYRATLKLLEAKGGAKYRAGALEQAQQELEQVALPASLGAAIAILKELFQHCEDAVFRGLLIGGRRPALLLFIDGMVQSDRVEQSILEPLVRWGDPEGVPGAHADLPTWLEAAGVTTTQSEAARTVGQAVDAVLGGDTLLLVDGVGHGVTLSTPGWKQRAVDEPSSEAMIRGPREGFVETLRTNTSLLRRRLRSPHLKIERMVIGRRSRTQVDVIFLKDITSPALVAEMKSRLQRIDVDGILDSGMLEEFIEDQPSSPFPQIINTERPDRVAAGLLEGKVAVMCDGSPFALMAPCTFWTFMHAGEDYYERFWISTFLLWIRYLFLLLALVGPSLYVAITTFHQEMLPTPLLLSVAAAREGIPFPALVEVFLMEIFFEALREAGVRLPRQVGQAVSIVGALVIGEAAVRAGLASAPVVIIVASTGIASFVFPRFNLGIAIRMLRFPMMALAGTLGLFGIMIGMILILIHLCALRSFGVPYLQPVAPTVWGGLKDVLVRAPLWLMGKRPAAYGAINRQRQAKWLKPGPGGNGS
jgi:spore germination protein